MYVIGKIAIPKKGVLILFKHEREKRWYIKLEERKINDLNANSKQNKRVQITSDSFREKQSNKEKNKNDSRTSIVRWRKSVFKIIVYPIPCSGPCANLPSSRFNYDLIYKIDDSYFHERAIAVKSTTL